MSDETSDSGRLAIEVVFALQSRQELISLSVDPGTTAEMAIRLSGIAGLFPQEDLSGCQAGIWGRPVDRAQVLNDGDRVELYRRLQMEPREARRKLAAVGASMGQRLDRPDTRSESPTDRD